MANSDPTKTGWQPHAHTSSDPSRCTSIFLSSPLLVLYCPSVRLFSTWPWWILCSHLIPSQCLRVYSLSVIPLIPIDFIEYSVQHFLFPYLLFPLIFQSTFPFFPIYFFSSFLSVSFYFHFYFSFPLPLVERWSGSSAGSEGIRRCEHGSTDTGNHAIIQRYVRVYCIVLCRCLGWRRPFPSQFL